MLIRQATPDDLPLIHSLERQSETAAHWAGRDYDALFAPEMPQRIALVAVDDIHSHIIGFAIARCGSDDWEIENVVVATDQKRRGLGSALVREVVQRAQQAAATSVLLEVRYSNTAARRLYEKLGFSQIGERPDYYQNPLESALLLKFYFRSVTKALEAE